MSTIKTFASQADLKGKKVTFARISQHAYAYTVFRLRISTRFGVQR